MLTPKQESFCLFYRETGNASEAYRLAGYSKKMMPKTVNEAASRLLADSKIVARLQQLGEVDMKRHNLTVDDIRQMLQQDRDFARELEAPAAAISASLGLAKLYGLLTDKTELTGKDGGAIKLEQVRSDAESFTSSIAGHAARIGASSIS